MEPVDCYRCSLYFSVYLLPSNSEWLCLYCRGDTQYFEYGHGSSARSSGGQGGAAAQSYGDYGGKYCSCQVGMGAVLGVLPYYNNFFCI